MTSTNELGGPLGTIRLDRYGSQGDALSRDSGSLSVFVAVLAVALFALVGLVVDAGRAVAARAAAMDQAEQAARAGAAQVSIDALRAGQIALNPASAVQAAEKYLANVGQSGSASVLGQTVTVRISESEPTVMLGIVGIHRIDISVVASATNVHGVTRQD
ncbi:MAG TPA: pilus assembly protein TadG-related protein [Acidimicrobiales bacterium]|nr:pilus assembly protein TadG-related protein [Acidimicrobiales bacterium]